MRKLIDYAKSFDPNYPARIRGSSRNDIEAFARLVGEALPAEYLEYLEYFGDSDGGLKLAFDGSTALPDLCDFYREYVQTGEVNLPRHCLAIGADGMTGEAICLQQAGRAQPKVALQEPAQPKAALEGPRRVVFTGGGEVRGGYAETLEKLLFRAVTFKLRLPLYAHQKIFLGGESGFDRARENAFRLGFTESWYSDSYVSCLERGDEFLGVVQYEGQPLSLHFACHDPAKLNAVDDLVHREFGISVNALQES